MLGLRQVPLKYYLESFILSAFLLALNIQLSANSLSLKGKAEHSKMNSAVENAALSIRPKSAGVKNTPKNDQASPNRTPQKTNETEKIGVVATVNGEPITIMDILEVCGTDEARLPYVFKGKQLEQEVKKLRLKALEVLIDRKLVYQEFKDKEYKLPKSFVEKNLDHLLKVFNVENRQELAKELKKHGSSMSEFKKKAYENAAVDALINDMCYRDVYITPKRVYDYYEKNKSQFTSPGKVHLQVLKLIKNGIHKEDLNVILRHLKSSFKNKNKKEFEDAVSLYSEGATLDKGGDIGWTDDSKLRGEFKGSVENAKVGDIVGPIQTEDACYFLRIAGRRQGKTESFNDVRERIENKLTNEMKEKNYKKYIDKLRKKAYIKRYL